MNPFEDYNYMKNLKCVSSFNHRKGIMKKIVIISLFQIIGLFAFAQEEKTKWEDNFYIGFSSSTYLDIVKSPLTFADRIVGNDPDPNDPNKVIPRYRKVPYQSMIWNLFSIGIEPRYNIKVVSNDAALAVSIPFSLGIGSSTAAMEDIGGIEGFGSFQAPLMLKYYMGNGSTYNCEKEYGISFGAGIEYNKVGMLGVPNMDDNAPNRGFVLPVASLGMTMWRNNMPFEINLKYGHGSIEEYDVDFNGNPLTNAGGFPVSRKTRSSSFKVTFVRLVNF